MTDRMSREAEEHILRGVEQVVDLVGDGAEPTAAVVKTAREGEYPPGHVRLIVQAYNTGRTNYLRKTGSDLYEKTAEFPLADAAAALAELYPERVKTAAQLARRGVSGEYDRPPDLPVPRRPGVLEKAARSLTEKRAEPYPRDPARLTKRAFGLLRDLEREREQRRALVAATRDKLAAALGELDDYFKTSGRPAGFPAVRANAALAWGPHAEAVLAKVAQANPRLEKEGSFDATRGRLDRGREPYRSVEACIKLACEHGRLEKEYQEFEGAAADAASRLLGEFLPAPVATSPRSILKQGFLGGVGKAVTETGPQVAVLDAVRGIADKVKPDSGDKLRNQAMTDLADPAHEARLQKIRSQAVLHGLLANDPFLSGERPERVTELYNQLSQLAPRASTQPVLMQALLNRYLQQGGIDPHELDQLVGVESKLKGLDQPVDPGFAQLRSILGESPPPPQAVKKE